MQIHLKLYSILREKLPPDAKGRAVIDLDEGATLEDLLEKLKIHSRVVISVNNKHETNQSRLLKNGDQVKIFSSISGG
ncbi:MAG: MoaD/ThiS family protein [Anaerolineales bacterium]